MEKDIVDDLFMAASNGDDIAFSQICTQIIPSLLEMAKSLCRRYGIPVDMADDLTQDTILRAAQAIQRPVPARLSTQFLYRIMRNVSLDMIKKKRAMSNQEYWLLQTPKSKPDMEQVDQMAVREAFDRLEEKDKQILGMILFSGHTTQEAAAILGVTVAATYKRYERALRRLIDIFGN